jgi:hypothetical protein
MSPNMGMGQEEESEWDEHKGKIGYDSREWEDWWESEGKHLVVKEKADPEDFQFGCIAGLCIGILVTVFLLGLVGAWRIECSIFSLKPDL